MLNSSLGVIENYSYRPTTTEKRFRVKKCRPKMTLSYRQLKVIQVPNRDQLNINEEDIS